MHSSFLFMLEEMCSMGMKILRQYFKYLEEKVQSWFDKVRHMAKIEDIVDRHSQMLNLL